ELFGIMERDAGPNLDRQCLVVGRPLPRRCKLRNDVELLIDVEELVAQRSEYDAADERAREGGIKDIGILGKAEAQRLREGRVHRQRGDAEGGTKANGQRGLRHDRRSLFRTISRIALRRIAGTVERRPECRLQRRKSGIRRDRSGAWQDRFSWRDLAPEMTRHRVATFVDQRRLLRGTARPRMQTPGAKAAP